MQPDQYRSCSTVKRHGGCRSVGPDGGQSKTALWLWVREMTWYLYTRWVCGRRKAKQHWFKITVSWMVSPCSASCSWRPLHWGIRHSDLTSRQFHSLVPWWRPRRIRPQKTRLSQLENSAMGKWPKTIMPVWFEKWRKWHIKFFYMCWFWSSLNCDVFPLLMMDNTRKMN